MQTNAMKVDFQIAECSLSSVKRYKNNFCKKLIRVTTWWGRCNGDILKTIINKI